MTQDRLSHDGAAAGDRVALYQSRLPRRLVLGNGIVLAYKLVPIDVLSAAENSVAIPDPPRVANPERGIDEPNPNDPEYLAAVERAVGERSRAKLTCALVLGTEVFSIPDGLAAPDDDGWIADLRETWAMIGVERTVHEAPPKARYLDWLLYYALEDQVDLFTVSHVLLAGFILSEEEVARAAASFRGIAIRPADLYGADAVPPLDGDSDPPGVPGDGIGV